MLVVSNLLRIPANKTQSPYIQHAMRLLQSPTSCRSRFGMADVVSFHGARKAKAYKQHALQLIQFRTFKDSGREELLAYDQHE